MLQESTHFAGPGCETAGAQYGSTPRRPHNDVMLACLSAAGELQWAQQYGAPFSDPFSNREPLVYAGLGATDAGGLVLVARRSANLQSATSTYVFDLDANADQ